MSTSNEHQPLIPSSSTTTSDPIYPENQTRPLSTATAKTRSEHQTFAEKLAMSMWTIGCLYGATSVVLGAFGSHGLKKRISDPSKLASWDTAARYQAIHSCALLISTVAAPKNKYAPIMFTVGMTMFSGSIYMLVLDSQRFKFLGPVTPIGGLILIGGWLAMAFGSRGRILT